MHHIVVERWSRGTSPLHTRDARAKLIVLLAFLVAVSTTPVATQLAFGGYALLLILAAVLARLPLRGLLARTALVLPFSATFAFLTWWAGDPARALAQVEKSLLSGLAALLLVSTTPFSALIAALDSWHFPRGLILAIQFLLRYLFVAADEGQRMRLAAKCRGGRVLGFQAAAGAVSVLFAKSWLRADGVHRAMLARGFRGRFVVAAPTPLNASDIAFVAACVAACLSIRLTL